MLLTDWLAGWLAGGSLLRGAHADGCESYFPKLPIPHMDKAAPFPQVSRRHWKKAWKAPLAGIGSLSDLDLKGGLSCYGLKQRQGGEHAACSQVEPSAWQWMLQVTWQRIPGQALTKPGKVYTLFHFWLVRHFHKVSLFILGLVLTPMGDKLHLVGQVSIRIGLGERG